MKPRESAPTFWVVMVGPLVDWSERSWGVWILSVVSFRDLSWLSHPVSGGDNRFLFL
jgi:hypothetical protein